MMSWESVSHREDGRAPSLSSSLVLPVQTTLARYHTAKSAHSGRGAMACTPLYGRLPPLSLPSTTVAFPRRTGAKASYQPAKPFGAGPSRGGHWPSSGQGRVGALWLAHWVAFQNARPLIISQLITHNQKPRAPALYSSPSPATPRWRRHGWCWCCSWPPGAGALATARCRRGAMLSAAPRQQRVRGDSRRSTGGRGA